MVVEENQTIYRTRSPLHQERNKSQRLLELDLIPPLVEFSDIFTRPEFSFLRDSAEIDLDIRYKDQWDFLATTIKEKNGDVDEARRKTVESLMIYNFSSLLANEVLISITQGDTGPSDFGNFVRRALVSVPAFPHGDVHTRNIDATQKLNIIMTAATTDDQSGLFTFAAGLKPIFHDFPQALMEYKKSLISPESHPTLSVINPKDDHKEVAAAIVVMLRPIFQQYGHMSEPLSRKLLCVLAADISAHDELTHFDAILSDTEKILAPGLPEDELYARYKNGTLNRVSILPQQWLTIVALKHQDMRSVYEKKLTEKNAVYDTAEFGAYGLGQELEHHFATLLERMKRDDSPGFDPSYESKKHEIHTTLIRFASIFNTSDTSEMVIPGRAVSYARKLNVPVNFSLPIVSKKDRREALWEVHPNNFNVSAHMRTVAEFASFARMIMGSKFKDTDGLIELYRHTVLYHFAQSEKTVAALIQGEAGLIEFDKSTLERAKILAEKAFKKSKNGALYERFEDDIAQASTIQEIIKIVDHIPENTLGILYKGRFIQRLAHIYKQTQQTKEQLERKDGPDDHKKQHGASVYVYGSEYVNMVASDFIYFWDQICAIFGMSKEESDICRNDMISDTPFSQLQKKYPMLPIPGYDSLGHLSDAKVLNKNNPFVNVYHEQQRLKDDEYIQDWVDNHMPLEERYSLLITH